MTINQARVREAFDYDAGHLRWRIKRHNKTDIGAIAGTLVHGYVRIGLDRGLYAAHRLIWMWVNGSLPERGLDHINGNPADNRIENLRLATQSENMQNVRRAQRNNGTGLLGVSYIKRLGKWRSEITINNKYTYIGLFATAQDAHAAYLAKKAQLHPFQMLVPPCL